MTKTSQTVTSIILSLTVLGAGFFFIHNKKDQPNINPPKNAKIVAFGDSLVRGMGSTAGNDFVSLLSRSIGAPIINEGKSGDTTVTAMTRLDEVIAHDPGTVIILLGGNDYLRKVPMETTFANLNTIIDRLKQNNTRVILLGVRGGLLKDLYDEDFAQLAKDQDVPYISNVLEDLIGNDSLMSDAIHPNDKGYAIIAERVLPVLREVLEG